MSDYWGMKTLRLSDPEFRLFQRIISEKIGLYFPEDKKNLLEIKLLRCLEKTGDTSFGGYYGHLQSSSRDSALIQDLSNQLSVRETSFFRNSAQFSALKDHVIPEIVAGKKGGKKELRVWSAGCATGQEPYSIAITLLESLPNPETWTLSILASDMSTESLEVAAKGIYNANAIKALRKTDLSRYFNESGEGAVVRDKLKGHISFLRHNLVTQPFQDSRMADLDIIFCRNVTIYFDLKATKKVMDKFHAKLVDGGYLFIGHSETLWRITDKFKTVEFPRTYIYRKEDSGNSVWDKPFTGLPPLSYQSRTGEKNHPVSLPPENTKDLSGAYQAGVRAVQSKEFYKAVSIFKGFKPGEPHYTEAKMDLATLLADLGQYDDAIKVLEEVLRDDNLNHWAYFHLGVLYNRKGDIKKSCEMFEKAIYVDPENVLASYHLAEICLRGGDTHAALRGFENTLKILKSMREDVIIPHSGDLTPALLFRSCHRNLDLIKRRKT